ncbi:unnamed protein product [Leptidea sinapis]|uniref:Mitochondrial ATP synthase regulatory component factor B n=1 Tax=Leptidea sinapis TaxID=189913 RepID=A0A5E4PYU3_9NEOP|nr:unnamed protein product [Leptidea sinapis]
MALTLRRKLVSNVYKSCRSYSDAEKSIYQKHEEAKHVKELYEWRKPWIKRDGENRSTLNIFVENNPKMSVLYAMQRLPHITFQDVKDWWADIKDIQEVENQKYLPERVATLGVNLAAVHYFTYRQAVVRLKGKMEWISGDITTLNLPTTYADGYQVEAVDCSKFHLKGIRYEGLQNLSGLNFLKWLSLRNNKFIDVWCFDRLAGQNGKTIEFLDISGCNLCVGSIFALSRMSALKYLVITDPGENIEIQAAISELEQERPELTIKTLENIEHLTKPIDH